MAYELRHFLCVCCLLFLFVPFVCQAASSMFSPLVFLFHQSTTRNSHPAEAKFAPASFPSSPPCFLHAEKGEPSYTPISSGTLPAARWPFWMRQARVPSLGTFIVTVDYCSGPFLPVLPSDIYFFYETRARLGALVSFLSWLDRVRSLLFYNIQFLLLSICPFKSFPR